MRYESRTWRQEKDTDLLFRAACEGIRCVQRIWSPHIGEKATTVREPDNECDRYAVAVLEQETCCVVGHIPREIAKECYISSFEEADSVRSRRRGIYPLGGEDLRTCF